jgi:hypothetical protein
MLPARKNIFNVADNKLKKHYQPKNQDKTEYMT